jgi:hypothetical protein
MSTNNIFVQGGADAQVKYQRVYFIHEKGRNRHLFCI